MNAQVSVVVTTRNRSERLGALLSALADQTAGPDTFEVVVVDNRSTDDTTTAVERALRSGDLHVRAVTNLRDLGTAASRNVGWRAAEAPLIAFTDDDCEPDPGWIEALLAHHRSHPGALLQGRTEPIPRERESLGPLSRTMEIRTLGPYFQTCNIAYPRKLLEGLGGFDEGTFGRWGGEDTDLAWRAMERGADTVFAEDALVHHAVHHLGFAGTLRLALKWSDAMAVIARHPGYRRHCYRWLFWKRSHADFLAAGLGAAVARRFPPGILLAVPYLRRLRRRAHGDPALAGFLALHDLLEIFATVRGGIRHRTPIV